MSKKKDPGKAGGTCKGNHTFTELYHKERKETMSELINNVDEFIIDTDVKAEWALKKIAEARADRDAWVKWYEEKIEQIKAQTDFDTMNLERMLSDYFATVPHKKTKTQESYTLPGGKLILKVQNPEYKRDDKKVIEWLKQNNGGQYIKVKEELAWSDLKASAAVLNGKLFSEDGEEIPGVEIIDREPKFVVEV